MMDGAHTLAERFILHNGKNAAIMADAHTTIFMYIYMYIYEIMQLAS